MILVYCDETGNRDARTSISRADGSSVTNPWLYVLTAVTLFDQKWNAFDTAINTRKRACLDRIYKDYRIRLDLADTEIKSNWLRIPKERARHPFLRLLTDEELRLLVEVYYEQLFRLKMHVFSVLIDKRYLHAYMDQDKIHRKSWELLLERIEIFMRERNRRHLALAIVDDTSKQANRSLAMKHAHFLADGTSVGRKLDHICELPLFTRSELSNGIQLADLCSYNIYRAFFTADLAYPHFEGMVPRIWGIHEAVLRGRPFSGLWVFPPESPLRDVVDRLEQDRAPEKHPRSP